MGRVSASVTADAVDGRSGATVDAPVLLTAGEIPRTAANPAVRAARRSRVDCTNPSIATFNLLASPGRSCVRPKGALLRVLGPGATAETVSGPVAVSSARDRIALLGIRRSLCGLTAGVYPQERVGRFLPGILGPRSPAYQARVRYDECMSTAPAPVTDADALAAARALRARADRCEVELLTAACAWADAHPPRPGDDPAYPDEYLPAVAWDATAPFGLAVGLSDAAGTDLIHDGLELRHRLPRIWRRLQAGTLTVWRARRIAARSIGHPDDVAAWRR